MVQGIRTLRPAAGSVVAVFVVALFAQAADRSQPRDARSGAASKVAPIQKRQLTNGLPVWIAEHHELPIVQMSLVVLTGTGDDPPGRYGIASLASAMLTAGAGPRSSRELADGIERLGANLSPSSGIDSSSLQLSVPAARLADALSLMADVAQRPTFPMAELERLRQQRLATLVRARDDPDAIAALAFSRIVYGSVHRYGTALIGTADTIAAFTWEDLDAFHRSTYRPGNSALIVAGDVVADAVLPLLETHFGKWQPLGATGGASRLAPVPQNAVRRLMLIDQPDAPQSRILVGGVGASRSDAEFFPIQVVNAVLLGRLNSRLNQRLPGDTSGVRSGFDVRKSPGPFVVGAAVRTDKTAELLTEIFGELTAMLRELPVAELARAKNDIALRFETTFEASGRMSTRLQSLESLFVYGLPDDYYSRYVQAVQAVSAADVQLAAQKYIQPDKFTVVVVGDLRTIEPGIRALKLGSIERMTLDEVFAPAK